MLQKLKKIFEEHNLVLFDNSDFGEGTGKTIHVPSDRIVSYKWLSRVLSRKDDLEMVQKYMKNNGIEIGYGKELMLLRFLKFYKENNN